jgi:predicted XRE-type DNA-binding protein
MSTNTSSALDQPTMTAPTPTPPQDKVMRITTMTKQLLDEVHTQPLDTASLERLRTIDTHIIDELLTDFTPDLREELQRLALPLTRHAELSDAEMRLAHAQLVGWLHGLLQTTQTALSDPHTVAANDSKTVQTAPNHHDGPHVEPCRPTTPVPDDTAPREENLGTRAARQTLITAITRRITQQRLTAAQAAAVLHPTGPRATQLLQANTDDFTLDELVNLLPALQLVIQVVPAPEQELRGSG